MAEAEEYAGGDEDVAAAEQEEDVDEVCFGRAGPLPAGGSGLRGRAASGDLYGLGGAVCVGVAGSPACNVWLGGWT